LKSIQSKIFITKYCFRYDNITEIPSGRTTRYGLKSFRYAAAKLWNELPNNFRTQTASLKKCHESGQKLKLDTKGNNKITELRMNDIWLIYPIYLNIYLAFLRHLTA
jgi:hypothetical protein